MNKFRTPISKHAELTKNNFVKLTQHLADFLSDTQKQKLSQVSIQLLSVIERNCEDCAKNIRSSVEKKTESIGIRKKFLLRLVGSKISHLCNNPSIFPKSIFDAIDTYMKKAFGHIVYEELNIEAEHILLSIDDDGDEFMWLEINKNPRWKRLAETILIRILLRFEQFQVGKRTFMIIINDVTIAKSKFTFADEHFTILFNSLFSELGDALNDENQRIRLDFHFGDGVSKRIRSILDQGMPRRNSEHRKKISSKDI
ncbi:hypothetical protein [Magnetospirillum sp. ME-1]|uniref:hypothetical protein n=1 Tax=Magnetospirillum sp. ME-1 TaxID=1639348 RepID=UPI0011AE436D|nr:hypothetical protein [Magnetospirillum sp. ME-1]